LTPRLVLVEDVYGVGFHKQLLTKLGYSKDMPRIERIPAKECNPALVRKVKAKLLRLGNPRDAKILVALDTENQEPEHVKQRVLIHFRKDPHLNNRIQVVAVEPKHDTWLCIGLGLDPHQCKIIPEHLIARSRGLKSYSKEHLGKLARYMDPQKLAKQKDFKEYLEAIKWLTQDP